MRPFARIFSLLASSLLGAASLSAQSAKKMEPHEAETYADKARAVMEYTTENFWIKDREIYREFENKPKPDFIWGGGISFSALVGGARHDKKFERMMRKYFDGLESYWDEEVDIPGYEPSPTAGNGNDKYYDDNAWMVLTFEEAYRLTGQKKYLRRAQDTLDFVLSGEDEKLGGGIWWHEGKKDGSKNTCVTAPAALGCYVVARHLDEDEAKRYLEAGSRLIDWTTENLQDPDNFRFWDRIDAADGKIARGQLTYNTALMQRAFLARHLAEGKPADLRMVKKISEAADGFVSQREGRGRFGKGAYGDSEKWSHLMVEADIELYRFNKNRRAYNRAKDTVDAAWKSWLEEKPEEMINQGSIARMLWLMADLDSKEQLEFWEEEEELARTHRDLFD